MKIRIQRPSDQPTGSWRLLDDLEQVLKSADFDHLRVVVAFAKAGPILKLQSALSEFRRRGGRVSAVIGVDQHGTSIEALQLALASFDETFVVRANTRFQATFHPKVYVARGPKRALALIGSNNLTVGGTELNPESLVEISLELPVEESQLADVEAVWADATSSAVKLDDEVLGNLVIDDVVRSEAKHRIGGFSAGRGAANKEPLVAFPKLSGLPPRALPRRVASSEPRKKTKKGKAPIPTAGVGTSLVMEVLPHHNGEVFLSKTAVDQDQAFFGWPFSGKTTPKRWGNPAYPQRLPDPVVSIEVVDSRGKRVAWHSTHNLNMVFYSKKSEIRITVPPDVVKNTPEYSILVMSIGDPLGPLAYRLTFYAPGGQEHTQLRAACNQVMPSGGKARARRFGWL